MSRYTISFLLPTRGRPNLLKRSVHSVYELAGDPGDVEVVIATDMDDDSSSEAISELMGLYPPIRHFVCTRWGYGQFHEYFNFLAEHASGRWLTLWNDDAIMETLGYDLIVREFSPGVLSFRTNHGDFNLFPSVHYTLHRAMGHFSLSPHCDSWLTDVANEAGCLHPTEIHAFHDRFDLTGNNNDQTFQETHGQYQTHAYYSTELAQQRSLDAEKIARVLQS